MFEAWSDVKACSRVLAELGRRSRVCVNTPLDRSLWSRLGGGITLNQ